MKQLPALVCLFSISFFVTPSFAEVSKEDIDTMSLKEVRLLLNNVDDTLEMAARCAEKNNKNELKEGVCIVEGMQKLADEGNFVAEHGLGNIYEDLSDKDNARRWYQKALDNPKTPKAYKPEVISDMDRLKAKK